MVPSGASVGEDSTLSTTGIFVSTLRCSTDTRITCVRGSSTIPAIGSFVSNLPSGDTAISAPLFKTYNVPSWERIVAMIAAPVFTAAGIVHLQRLSRTRDENPSGSRLPEKMLVHNAKTKRLEQECPSHTIPSISFYAASSSIFMRRDFRNLTS